MSNAILVENLNQQQKISGIKVLLDICDYLHIVRIVTKRTGENEEATQRIKKKWDKKIGNTRKQIDIKNIEKNMIEKMQIQIFERGEGSILENIQKYTGRGIKKK